MGLSYQNPHRGFIPSKCVCSMKMASGLREFIARNYKLSLVYYCAVIIIMKLYMNGFTVDG